jgi:hypothetical protein
MMCGWAQVEPWPALCAFRPVLGSWGPKAGTWSLLEVFPEMEESLERVAWRQRASVKQKRREGGTRHRPEV